MFTTREINILRTLPTTSEQSHNCAPGYYVYGKIPWWVLQQMEEIDYTQDVMYMNRTYHHRLQQEMNERRRKANRADRLRKRLATRGNKGRNILPSSSFAVRRMT